MKLWGGRFEEGPSEAFERFSGSLDFDRRHSFIGNFVWEIPKTRARGVLGQIANGWQLSGIYRYQTGQPYNLSVSIPGIGSTNILETCAGRPRQFFKNARLALRLAIYVRRSAGYKYCAQRRDTPVRSGEEPSAGKLAA